MVKGTSQVYKILLQTFRYYDTGYYHTTVNWEYFVVKIFSDSLAYAKIKHAKYMRIIISNAVRGRLSENYLTRKCIVRNIFGTKYSRFTVV